MGNRTVVILMIFVLCLTPKGTFSASVNKISDDDDLVVQLDNPVGKIRGHTLEDLNGNYYYAFQDIPYAKPPTGEFRFKPPRPLDNWDGIIETTSNQKQCPQPGMFLYGNYNDRTQTEDCLILNVYSPVKPGSNASLPVYLWIHGGGFQGGGAEIDSVNPVYFIESNIVVVSIQYRVGVLGFLTLNDENIPGNLGLKDQQLAIKWTSENIHLFGGNPKHIVIGGQSAGSISTSYQVLSKANQGLIKAVIQESGSAITAYGFTKNYTGEAFEFGRRMNFSIDTNDNKKLLELLVAADLQDILQAQKEWVSDERIGYMTGEYWKPIVEHEDIEGAFLTEPMREAFEKGDFNRVPMLLGFNEEESLTMLQGVSEEDYQRAAENFDSNSALMVNDKLNVDLNDTATAGAEVKALYTSVPFLQNKTGFVRYCSDASFIRSTIRQAEASSQYIPVYLYQFSYSDSEENDIPGAGLAGHGAELPYFWNPPSASPSPGPNPSVQNETLRTSLLKLWTNFIKEQNPTPTEDEVVQNIIWPTTTADTLQYLNINRTFSINTLPRQYKDVKAVYDQYMQRPFNVY